MSGVVRRVGGVTQVFRLQALFPLPEDRLPGQTIEITHGEVFTRPWVVDFILDLLDYRPGRDLAALRLVEPSCGAGAFVESIARRIGASCRSHGRDITEALGAVRAFDLLDRNVTAARDRVTAALIVDGWEAKPARRVATAWIRQGDYLLDEVHDAPVDVVVGNPPYLRLEDVPDSRMRAYRDACPTMIGRSDLYVGFFETALGTLAPGGRLGFICADRWMRNQYGRALRKLVTSRYSVEAVIGMHQVDAFDAQVCAYPAVTIVGNAPQRHAVAATASREFDAASAQQLATWMRAGTADAVAGDGFSAARLPHWFTGDDLWPAASPARLRMLEDLTDRFTALGDPESGVRVGIGVATGADAVFITDTGDLPVELDRLLPLAMVRDTKSGQLQWSGHYLVNPWDEEGKLVDLVRYPRLAAYLARHETQLRARHVGRRQPHRWYRTIDKVDATLTSQPKLLLADLKLTSEPVLDPGGHYPHHNLYFLTSDLWDLRILGGLLLSKVAEAFIDAYAVKMSGGTLRFQAQYLRRIPIPALGTMTDTDREALIDAFERRDAAAATQTALHVYGLATLPG
ncbi:MAG: N-6 DNA methylase [Dactylosporangium sp.]|nr:Eco57I restriction-modification methylase domain-containing protein [Dactylosporangium sp.]NNJ62629.1 N-6 DNA methylase [Dactylosporangium sp.]